MTFLQSKQLLKTILLGDTKVPDDDDLKIIYEQALLYISNKCTPLKLLTNSKDFSLLRIIGDGVYVRKAKLPKQDGDTLDIDDELGSAVVNYSASILTKNNKEYYMNKCEEIIDMYQFKIENAKSLLEELANDNC